MNEASRWGQRVSSLHLSGKGYWCSHSLYGAFLGIFLSEAEAAAASEAYDVVIEIEADNEENVSIQLITATIRITGQGPFERHIAYHAKSEVHAGFAAENAEMAYSDLKKELSRAPGFT